MKMKKVSLLLPERLLEDLKELVRKGEFSSINEIIRTAIRFYLKNR